MVINRFSRLNPALPAESTHFAGRGSRLGAVAGLGFLSALAGCADKVGDLTKQCTTLSSDQCTTLADQNLQSEDADVRQWAEQRIFKAPNAPVAVQLRAVAQGLNEDTFSPSQERALDRARALSMIVDPAVSDVHRKTLTDAVQHPPFEQEYACKDEDDEPDTCTRIVIPGAFVDARAALSRLLPAK